MAILRVDHVGIAVPDLDEAIAFYRDVLRHAQRARRDQRRTGRPRGDAGGRRRQHHDPAAGPAAPRHHVAKFLDRTAPASSRWPTPWTTSTRPPRSCARGACGCSTTRPRRHGRLPGELRPPQGRRRRAGRTGRAGVVQLAAAHSRIWCGPTGAGHCGTGHRPARCAAGHQPALKTLLISNLFRTPSPRTGGIPMDQIRAAVNAEDPNALSDHRQPAGPGRLRRDGGAGRRGRHVRRPGHPRQGPAQVAAPAAGADPGGRAGRGADRGDGQRDQLQHGVDLDLRAGVDLRLPAAVRPKSRSWPASTTCPTTWSARTCPAWCCGSAPASPSGSPATRSWRTACRSSWRTRAATTTR